MLFRFPGPHVPAMRPIGEGVLLPLDEEHAQQRDEDGGDEGDPEYGHIGLLVGELAHGGRG